MTQDLIAKGGVDVEPIWIVIESIINDTPSEDSSKEEVKGALLQLKTSLKRMNDSQASTIKKVRVGKNCKVVRFKSPEPEKLVDGIECLKEQMKIAVETPILLDFSRNQDLCVQI